MHGSGLVRRRLRRGCARTCSDGGSHAARQRVQLLRDRSVPLSAPDRGERRQTGRDSGAHRPARCIRRGATDAAAVDAGGVPASPRQHRRDLRRALRPPEYAATAPPPHRRGPDVDLRRDDWLTLEIAVKLVRLRSTLAKPDTPPPSGGEDPTFLARVWRGRNEHPTKGGRMTAGTATLERSARRSQRRGIEFFFAQFVDMYGRPSAKLVPVARPGRPRRATGRASRGSRPARSARCPRDPDIAAIPDPQLHARAVAAGRRAVRLRRHGRGRAVAVLPAHDPAQTCSRGARELGYEFKIGIELEYFLVRSARTVDRDRRQVRHAREALLRHGGPDAPATTS